MTINSVGYQQTKNPIAQSFYVDEANGIFVTKIQLFFKSTFAATADMQLPVSIHLRPMRNGMPSDVEIIPGSTVYVPYNLVNAANDASSPTDFVFEEPVFLDGFTDYAVVVYAEAPEYEIWISEVDDKILGSASARVNVNPNLGSLFYSQNGSTFSPNQKQDLKFNIVRAVFDTTVIPKINLKNASVPRELLNPNPIRTFENSNTIRVLHTNHGLQVGDTVSITSAAATGGFTANDINGDHSITAIDLSGYEFTLGSNADSDEVGGGTLVNATKNIPYSIVWPNIGNLKPLGTDLFASYKGTGGKSLAGVETPYQLDTEFTNVSLNKNNFALEHPYVIAADSIADAEIAVGASTAEMEIQMSTASDLVSPIVDLQRSSITLIDNIIDNQDSAATNGFNVPLNFVAEEQPSGNSGPSRHITSVTTLTQTAVGLKVLLSANRPKPADIKVYYRVADEGTDISSVNWKYQASSSNNPPDANKRTFREYEYMIGGQGGHLPAFTKFQLKIVMTSTNSALVPVVKDLRVIALSV